MLTLVYKVGGSLLDLPDLSSRIGRVLARTPGVRPLLVVGGGAAADLVRQWDRLHRLGEEPAHWLALRAMTLNEALLAELKPECRIVRTRDEAETAWKAAHIPIVCAHDFVKAEERVLQRGGLHRGDEFLPHTWDATSDSIAAWIALRWPADGLVLMKSCPAPLSGVSGGTDEIDPCFPALARRLPHIAWINLRSSDSHPADA